MMINTVWSSPGPMLGVIAIVVVGVSIWHSDWESAGTNRSHSKSTVYGMLFKNRTGPD